MTPTLMVALFLGAGGLLTGLYTLWSNIQDRKVDQLDKQSKVELTEEQKKQVAADAASINSREQRETERWWLEQFELVKKELRTERRWRRRVTDYIKEHQPWDVQAQQKLNEHGVPIPPPPTLDLDDIERDLDEEALS